MTKFQTILVAILSAVVAGLLYKFVPDLKEVAGGLAGIALLMLGWAKQHPADKPQAAPIEVVDPPTKPLLPNPRSDSKVI